MKLGCDAQHGVKSYDFSEKNYPDIMHNNRKCYVSKTY